MPHIPSQMAPTTGIRPEFMSPPKIHRPIPIPEAATTPTEETGRRKISARLPRISPHTYEPDPGRLLKTLFGKEPERDDATGQLVYTDPAIGKPNTFGSGG